MEQKQNPHNGKNNTQRINNNRTTALEQTSAYIMPLEGLNVFYWYQIFALDSVVVKPQKCLGRVEAS